MSTQTLYLDEVCLMFSIKELKNERNEMIIQVNDKWDKIID